MDYSSLLKNDLVKPKRVMKIKQFSRKDHLVRALIYGASGVGKTHFAGTVAHRAIYASSEGGLLTIADKKLYKVKNFFNFEFVIGFNGIYSVFT